MHSHHGAALLDAPDHRGTGPVKPVVHGGVQHEADGRFPRRAEQNPIAQSHDAAQITEHREIVRRVLGKTKTRIEPYLVPGNAGRPGHRHAQPQIQQQVGPKVAIGPVRPVVHQDDRTAERGHRLCHRRTRQSRGRIAPRQAGRPAPALIGIEPVQAAPNVVDDVRPCAHRGRGDRGFVGIDRQRGVGKRPAKRGDRRKHPVGFLRYADRRPTRPGRFAADIEHVGAGRQQGARTIHDRLDRGKLAAVGKGIGGYV